MPKLVNISGVVGAGKSTLARLLSVELSKIDIQSQVVSYAAPLHLQAYRVFGTVTRETKEVPVLVTLYPDELEMQYRSIYNFHPQLVELLDSFVAETYNQLEAWGEDWPADESLYTYRISPREFLQIVSIAAKLTFGADVYSNNVKFLRDVNNIALNDVVLIADDCRYPTESDLGHINVYIDLKSTPEETSLISDAEEHHKYLRERSQFIVDNDKDSDLQLSYAELEESAKTIAEFIKRTYYVNNVTG